MCFFNMKARAIVQLSLLTLLHELFLFVVLGQCWLFWVWVFVFGWGFFCKAHM